MLRLLFFAPRLFPPGEISGAARTLEALCAHLAAAGQHPFLLTDHTAPPDFPVPIVTSSDPTADLAATARARHADAVVIWGAYDVGPAVAACRAAGVPIVMYFQNCELGTYDHLFDSAPDMLCLAVSRFVVDRLRAWCGVAAEALAPIIAPPAETEGSRDRVLFINPIATKGCEIAFAIAQRLRHAPFLVLESWTIPPGWRSYCLSRVGPYGNIDWRTATPDMRPIWASTRVLLMPSIWEEAWGRAASEAQAHGIPVVASARGGLPEAVGDGGVLLDAHAPIEEWAGAVDRLLRDHSWHATLARAARAHAARPEIQPPGIVARFVELVSRHVARCRETA